MLTDATIIHRSGTLHVLAEPAVVDWPDGSTLPLHPIALASGTPALLLRALQVDGAWLLLDLQGALPELADDIRQHHRRDHRGLVRFTLRCRWGSAGACLAWLRPHLRPLPDAPAGDAAAPAWPLVEPAARVQLALQTAMHQGQPVSAA